MLRAGMSMVLVVVFIIVLNSNVLSNIAVTVIWSSHPLCDLNVVIRLTAYARRRRHRTTIQSEELHVAS